MYVVSEYVDVTVELRRMCGEQGNWLLILLPTYTTTFYFVFSVFSLDTMACTQIYRSTLCSVWLVSLGGLPFSEGRIREGKCVEEAGEPGPGEAENSSYSIIHERRMKSSLDGEILQRPK